ncbi:hypothetical protein V1283_005855 [Bradyrhizobium sp. AZCC 2262]
MTENCDPEVPGEPGSLKEHGNPNVVTFGSGTSKLWHSPAAETILVEDVSPPRVTAFDWPAVDTFGASAPCPDRKQKE